MTGVTGTKELIHRLRHVSPQAALRDQHATVERDQVSADRIDDAIAMPDIDHPPVDVRTPIPARPRR